MPNLDSGRYFLTSLFPIRNGPHVDMKIGDDLVMPLLPVQAVRHVLSVGATAQQGPATYWVKNKDGSRARATKNSHFADNLKTHFTRIFVIDKAAYNGRDPSDVILDKIRGVPVIGQLFGEATNLLDPQPVDQLSHAYLVWVAEIDAPKGEEAELDHYLEELWQQMPQKLSGLFMHCHGFDAENMNGEKFRQFIRQGQVETSMSFNDYWSITPQLESFFQSDASTPTKFIGSIGVFVTAGALLGFFYHFARWVMWGSGGTGWWLGFFVLSLILTITIAGILAYRGIMKFGRKPFPMAPGSDLPSVLKSLYLQQNFTRFAIASQCNNAQNLHDEFGQFLTEHKPDDVNNPTQDAGTIVG